ncbi:acetylornithine deacetylase/succinyl-diaminopimelate desuccinylase-like protein [Diaminobutyricimonas aerilata]|uniref:Acetylornithine deacetylase/succinyl-diaminopimelate desuccinylase-like protein n=1 Tax=Diaminobutyricimonas aerilata TaxID=1162967 RepID=A0A2M9CKE4_9MICO|nr:dipeptidase [Diaminobutyricimonas aerilata]PJJ72370.1 acetylornithine deacetylase/succinyl-diaminopimelate desuccinylase-like protein [Diaminobutyricimonas aerilata]
MTEIQAPNSSAASDRPAVEEAVRTAVQEGLPATIADLSRLVRVPSVAFEGFDHSHVQASAEAVRALFEETGAFDEVVISRAPIPGSDELGQPAVLGTRAARNGAPTVLLYAHHDVQPVGDESGWLSPAFEPTLRGDRLYGRGTADDKAGIMSHIASIRALIAAHGPDFDLGLVVFIEGEEEFGSRSFSSFLAQHRDQLAADVIIVADSGNWDTETPALTAALRGNVTFNFTIETLDHASHSGMFGGAVPDAMTAMIKLLATLHDDEGAVAVEGLRSYEAETPPYDEAQLRRESGLLDGVTPIGRGTILSRLWYQPSITVVGIDATSVLNASNTLSPKLRGRISVRIAPGQSPTEAFAAVEKHLTDHTPFGARVEITDIDLGAPFLVDTSGPVAAAALDAMRDAWDAEPVLMGVGGSIPFVADLVEVFPQAQILITGVEDPDSRAHSPNESLHLGVFHRGILSEALLLSRLGSRA